MVSHLHRRLRHARNLLAILLEVRQVAEDEDLRHAGRIQSVVDKNAATFIDGRSKHLAQRRCLHSRRPQGHRSINAFSASLHPSWANSRDLRPGVHFDT